MKNYFTVKVCKVLQLNIYLFCLLACEDVIYTAADISGIFGRRRQCAGRVRAGTTGMGQNEM